MPNLSLCRICLADNIRMDAISNTPEQEIFEKFTGAKLIMDGRPDTLCYRCSTLLRKFNKLHQMSQKAEEYLTALHKQPSAVPRLHRDLYNESLSAVQTMTVLDPALSIDKSVLKEEPNEPEESLFEEDNQVSMLEKIVYESDDDMNIDTDITEEVADNGANIISYEVIADTKEKLNIAVAEVTVIVKREITNDDIPEILTADSKETTDSANSKEIADKDVADSAKEKCNIIVTTSEDIADSDKISAIVTPDNEKKLNGKIALMVMDNNEETTDLIIDDNETPDMITADKENINEEIAVLVIDKDIPHTEILNGELADRATAGNIEKTNEEQADNVKESNDIEITNAGAISDKENEFPCDQCEKKFNFAHQLVFHKRLHARNSKKVCCNKCGKTFFTKSSFQTHTKKVHKEDTKKVHNIYVPSENETINAEINTVIESMRKRRYEKCDKQNETQVKVFECKKCMLSFSTETDWLKHTVIHRSAKIVLKRMKLSDLLKNGCKMEGNNTNNTTSTRLKQRTSLRLARGLKKHYRKYEE